MAIELGTAYLSLAASTGTLKADVRKAMGDATGEVDRASERAGNSLASKVGKGVKGIALGIGGLGVAVGGLAVHGGIARALNIDAAQAKMRGLGHDTESVDRIMENALASVKGTAFGLGEAAQTAAGAVAAGIEPGERLEQVLKSVANSAAASGTGMDEMGSIYNKVASIGKAQNDSLQRVAERGIPIYEALAEKFGVSTDAVFKMASEGKISFNDFEAAMTAASGTVAEEMGNTLPGKLDNARAALSRWGEKLVAGVLPHVGDGLDWFMGKVDEMTPVAERMGAAVGRAGQWMLDKLGPPVRRVGAWIRDDLIPAVSSVAGWLRDDLLPVVMDAARWIGERLAPHVQRLGEWIRDTTVPAIMDLARWTGDNLVPALRSAGDWIVRNKDWLAALVVTVGTAVGVWKTYVLVKTGWIAITKAAQAAQVAFNAVLRANPIGLVITAVAALAAGIVYFFTQTETGRRIWGNFTSWLVAKWEGLNTRATEIFTALQNFFPNTWNRIKNTASEQWGQITGQITGFARDIRSKVEDSFNRMKDGIGRAWSGIQEVVRKPINVVIGFINKGIIGAYNWVARKLGLDTLSDIPLVSAARAVSSRGGASRPLQAFATGGWTGPGSMWQPAGVVHADEHVWTKREMSRFPGGHAAMERWRRAVLDGRAEAHIPGYASGGPVRPVPGGHSGWNGGRYRSGGYHGGLDFPAGTGTPISAMWTGSVVRALRLNRSYGHHAILSHANGLQTLYAHMSRLLVSQGQSVGRGQRIGLVGSSGNSTGPHLHLEVRRGGARLNPVPFLSGASAGSAFAGVGASSQAQATSPWDEWTAAMGRVLTGPFQDFKNSIGGGMIADLATGVASKLKSSIEGWVKDKLFGTTSGNFTPRRGFASGVLSAPPGWAWTGEQGPELVRFRGGERVLSHPDSAKFATQSPQQTLVRVELVDERLRGLVRAEVHQMKREGVLVGA